MDLGSDAARPQSRHDLRATHADGVEIDQHDIKMKHGIAAGDRGTVRTVGASGASAAS